MLSLGTNKLQDNKAGIADYGVVPSGRRRVLPRVLRRPMRMALRFMAGDVSISRRGGLAVLLGLVVASAAGIFTSVNPNHSLVRQASAGMGFVVKSVQVEGISELNEVDILSRLDLGARKSLFSFNVKRARENIAKLAWVKDVDVAKAYPDRLIVRIVERKPFAVWQNGKSLALVERGGASIDQFDERFSDLPLLVGKNANVGGADIIYRVSKFPVIAEKVKAYIRIGDRRWDLRLDGGINIKLPAKNVEDALHELARLNTQHQLLARDVKIVDLRLPDRLVVRLSENAARARKAMLSSTIKRTRWEDKI